MIHRTQKKHCNYDYRLIIKGTHRVRSGREWGASCPLCVAPGHTTLPTHRVFTSHEAPLSTDAYSFSWPFAEQPRLIRSLSQDVTPSPGPLPSPEVRLDINSNFLILWLVFLVTSLHPDLSRNPPERPHEHIKDTPIAQEIVRVSEALGQALGANFRYIPHYTSPVMARDTTNQQGLVVNPHN